MHIVMRVCYRRMIATKCYSRPTGCKCTAKLGGVLVRGTVYIPNHVHGLIYLVGPQSSLRTWTTEVYN